MPLLQATTATSGDASWVDALTTELTTTKGVVGGTALVIGGRASASVADSTAVAQTNPGALAFDVTYSIPANMLNAGTTLKIRAVARVVTLYDTAGQPTCTLRIGGAAAIVSGAATANTAVGVRCVLEGVYTFRTGAGVGVAFSGVGTAVWGDVPGTVTMDPNTADAVPTVDTDAAVVIDVTTVDTVATGGGDIVLESLYVEII